ncbi:hypothetical protein C8Q75DRAFT_774686 [Abortiporus biennis]|nr:hypothetical protein C8Q75DRAFT_774686 [Abortiporus biennis]
MDCMLQQTSWKYLHPTGPTACENGSIQGSIYPPASRASYDTIKFGCGAASNFPLYLRANVRYIYLSSMVPTCSDRFAMNCNLVFPHHLLDIRPPQASCAILIFGSHFRLCTIKNGIFRTTHTCAYDLIFWIFLVRTFRQCRVQASIFDVRLDTNEKHPLRRQLEGCSHWDSKLIALPEVQCSIPSVSSFRDHFAILTRDSK